MTDPTTTTDRQVMLAGLMGRVIARAGLECHSIPELATLSRLIRAEHPELTHAELGEVLAAACRGYAATHPTEPWPPIEAALREANRALQAAVNRMVEHAALVRRHLVAVR